MKMELKSSIDRAWKIGTLWSFLAFLTLVFIVNNQTHQISNFLAALDEYYIPITSILQQPKKCNIFEGKWVFDPERVRSYDPAQCHIMEMSFRCRQNERQDFNYEKWRWEPTDCDLPLFNGTDMLERLRNKRMVISGDSLNKNQWNSLACLLYSSVSDPSRAELRADFFYAQDYNFTAEFIWSSFLVELNNKDHESGRRVLVLDKISSASEKWLGADVMLFNSWHWWTHEDSVKAWDAYEYKGQLIDDMPRELAYERGMKTWARWMENNVDPKKTTVFFRTNSESHYGRNSCLNATQPITDADFFESRIPKSFIEINQKVTQEMSKVQVKYLNITKLSQYRIDAHPSVYTSLTAKNGNKRVDCGHWCLPGLPDTWNRLLYVSLL